MAFQKLLDDVAENTVGTGIKLTTASPVAVFIQGTLGSGRIKLQASYDDTNYFDFSEQYVGTPIGPYTYNGCIYLNNVVTDMYIRAILENVDDSTDGITVGFL